MERLTGLDAAFLYLETPTHHMHVAMNELEPVVESLTIRPKVLQRKSNGQFVTAIIHFAPGFNAADIDASSLTLIVDGNTATLADERHVTVPGSNTDGANSLTVKFDRSTLNNVLEGGEVEVAVTGSVDDVFFQVSETITVK